MSLQQSNFDKIKEVEEFYQKIGIKKYGAGQAPMDILEKCNQIQKLSNKDECVNNSLRNLSESQWQTGMNY